MQKTKPVTKTDLVVLESRAPDLTAEPPVLARQASQIAEISIEVPFVNESYWTNEEIIDTVKTAKYDRITD